MRTRGHQPTHGPAGRSTPPTGGSGVRPPPPRLEPRALAMELEYVALVAAVGSLRQARLREAAEHLREVGELRRDLATYKAANQTIHDVAAEEIRRNKSLAERIEELEAALRQREGEGGTR